MKNHGKRKRKRLDVGRGGTRSSDELQEKSVTATEGEGEGRSIYFVVNILVGSNRAVASLYKVDYPYPCSPTPSPRRLHPVATMDTTAGITYVPVQTRSRRWIVALSARRTTVFDADTQ